MAKKKPDWQKGLTKKQISDAKKMGRRWNRALKPHLNNRPGKK